MPTYEYECRKCRKHSEVRQEITARALTKCTKCGGRLKRIIGGGGGLIFRGTGFYVTDYRKPGYKAKEKAEKSSASDKSKSSSSGAAGSSGSGGSCSGSPSSCAKPDCGSK